MNKQPGESFRGQRIWGGLISAIITLGIGYSPSVFGQGCIASRGTCLTPGHSDIHAGAGEILPPSSGFQAAVGYRWLHSDRMFANDVEQKQIETEGSQEINDSHFIDLSISYAFTPRFSATLTLPFSVHDRSQVVRAYDGTIVQRFHTQASGIGDVRLEGNAWLLDPQTHMKGNVLLGVGVSAPSGDRDAQDTFLVPSFSGPRARRLSVDQSIQPGNGGWGILLDLYAYWELAPRLNGFVNGSYTFTPEEKYSPTATFVGDYSIADSYLGRGGFEYLVWPKHSLTLSLAGRIDGVPVHDLVGGSGGFRRPGYAVSIEPGVSLAFKSWSISVNTPVALYRNREQSVSEKNLGLDPVAAGFADFIVTCSVMKSF